MAEVAAAPIHSFEEAQRAIVVLSTVLGDFYSEEDVERHASTWEVTHGSPLVRPWEEKDPQAFAKRAAKFGEKTGLSGDPAMFRADLAHLMEINPKGERQIRQIHELQEVLGIPKTDFMQPTQTAKEIIAEAKKRYAEVQAFGVWTERLAVVNEETNVRVLQMLMEHDKRSEIREAAEARLALLTAMGQ
jgi:hypothetical protein